MVHSVLKRFEINKHKQTNQNITNNIPELHFSVL